MRRTVGKQMRSASRVVEVRAQERCDYADPRQSARRVR